MYAGQRLFAWQIALHPKMASSVEKEILFKAGLKALKKIKLDTHDDEQAVVNNVR